MFAVVTNAISPGWKIGSWSVTSTPVAWLLGLTYWSLTLMASRLVGRVSLAQNLAAQFAWRGISRRSPTGRSVSRSSAVDPSSGVSWSRKEAKVNNRANARGYRERENHESKTKYQKPRSWRHRRHGTGEIGPRSDRAQTYWLTSSSVPIMTRVIGRRRCWGSRRDLSRPRTAVGWRLGEVKVEWTEWWLKPPRVKSSIWGSWRLGCLMVGWTEARKVTTWSLVDLRTCRFEDYRLEDL